MKKPAELENEEFDISQFEVDEDGRWIVPLLKPIKQGSETITEFRMREPVAKDMRKLKGDPTMDDILNLAGALANQPPSVIDKLKMKDMQRVTGIVGNAIAGGL